MPQPQLRPLTPLIVCDDVDKTYEYFTQVLGFAGAGKMPGPTGSTMHAEVVLPTRIGNAFVMLAPRDQTESNPESGEFGENLGRGPLGNGVVLYLNVPDVDKYFDFVRARGALVDKAPKDQFWGERTASIRTPDGYFLTFGAPVKGFTWPQEQLASITGATKATAPATVGFTPPHLAATTKTRKAATRRPATRRAATPKRGRTTKARKARR